MKKLLIGGVALLDQPFKEREKQCEWRANSATALFVPKRPNSGTSKLVGRQCFAITGNRLNLKRILTTDVDLMVPRKSHVSNDR